MGWILLAVVGAAVLWIRQSYRRSERQRERDLDELGLRKLDEEMRRAVIRDGRPLGTDVRWMVVDTMRQMLREAEQARASVDSVAIVDATNELVLLACEELVKLDRMIRVAERQYAFKQVIRASR